MSNLMAAALVALVLTSVGCSTAEREATDEAPASPAADNTAMNVRDQNSAELTPVDQDESESDRAITQGIRQMIAENDSLSVNAKNVKIITSGSEVTLRGPVDSNEERVFIVNAARVTTGVIHVDDQLELVAYQGS